MLNLGKLRLAQKNHDGAIDILSRAVETNQKSPDANYLLGEAYLGARKGSKAVGYLNQAILLDPVGKADVHLRLAALYKGAGLKDKAAAEYEMFLAKKPDYPDRKNLEQYIRDSKNPQ
jgi:tetratricopeptide (TPR) repeat protein